MAILLFILTVNALLGVMVLARNTRSLVNWLFFIMALAICLWATASFLTDNAPLEQRLLFGRLAFVFPIIVSLCLALMSRVFPIKLGFRRGLTATMFAISAVGIVMCFSGLMITGIHVRPDGTDLLTGPLYFGFVFIVLFLLGCAIQGYVQSRHRANSLQRLQARYMAVGFLVSFIWALVFNVLLPLVVASWASAKFGPAGTVIFVGATAYAIIRHRLFDIRLIVARSVAYVLVLGAATILYSAAVFGVSALLSDSITLNMRQQFVYVILAILVAFSLQPLRAFFDRLTNHLFYRDAYDPQVFLNRLNELLVNNIDLDALLKGTAGLIAETLKAEFCVYDIVAVNEKRQRLIGYNAKGLRHSHFKVLHMSLLAAEEKLLVTDEVPDAQTNLRQALQKSNIAVLGRMTETSQKRAFGYLLLGVKKSGNPYSRQDIRLAEIITDELSIAIQNALRFEEIQNFNIKLREEVETATRHLKQTNERLKMLDQTKDDFISMASHQLRTPLTSVKGYLSMVLEGDAGKLNPKEKKLLNQAFSSSQRMVYLIADLLNLSRLKTGKFIIEPTPVNLAEIIEGEVSQLIETAASRNLRLTYHKPKTFPTLMLDETKIRQVIMNFVDNSIHYTPSGGHIEVHLRDTPQSVEFLVKDDGIGVPRAEQAHLFTKFFRAGNARQARPDGTGLGLYMAKKVIIAQGGSTIFRSQSGKGSTFGFTFPKAKLLPPAHAATHPAAAQPEISQT